MWSGHYYVLYDGGEDNPNSNADALHLIANDPSIAVRSFNLTSETDSVEMTFLGHLAAVNDRAERVRNECGDYSKNIKRPSTALFNMNSNIVSNPNVAHVRMS